VDRFDKALKLVLVLALIAWLGCAAYAGHRILDDQLSDTTIRSSISMSSTAPGGKSFSVHQDVTSTVSGPAQTAVTGPENPLAGIVPSLSDGQATTSAAGESDGGDAAPKPSSTAPSSTTPAGGGGGGGDGDGGPVIASDGSSGSDVTFFAFLLLIGAGLLALLLRALAPTAPTAATEAAPEPSTGDAAIGVMQAAAQAKTAQRRAGVPPRDELSDLFARQAITYTRRTGQLAEALVARLRAVGAGAEADLAQLERLADQATKAGAAEVHGKLDPKADLTTMTELALRVAKSAGRLAIDVKAAPPAPATSGADDDEQDGKGR
jgi:hypothetical protein